MKYLGALYQPYEQIYQRKPRDEFQNSHVVDYINRRNRNPKETT